MARTGRSWLAIPLFGAGVLLLAGALALLVNVSRAEIESGRAQAAVLEELRAQIPDSPEALLEGNMPVITVDGREYIGILDIPALGLSLPVQSTWDDEGSQVSPCRWSGSAYDGDLVVAGRPYQSQLAAIGQLAIGDQLFLTDGWGNRLEYQVVDQQTPRRDDEVDVSGGSDDLLLWTYAPSGLSGVAVCCDLVLG